MQHKKYLYDMANFFWGDLYGSFIILGIIFLIYRVAFEVPKDIRKLENKIDILKFHLQEIELRLDKLDKK